MTLPQISNAVNEGKPPKTGRRSASSLAEALANYERDREALDNPSK